ncbi:hypothetical protein [Caulobacter sp. RL271]|jgi:hypothetical protein|uniref:Lipoprotein n=1 Tax=Caulobacter segnis TaxID=88688 RepID=A0ABY4ZPZ9_9CAUL|nr:hypothetical protein [Caulobacter segnis]USQ94760.1 hypothetical protein MZV50_19620 [Caulobacter segnis]
MRRTVLALTALALVLSGCGRTDPSKPEGGMMLGLRAIFAFKACTGELEERFGLVKVAGITSNDMNPIQVGPPGNWDVTFTADVTEKPTGRVTRYKGVCHVRRDRPTSLDATFLKEIRPGEGVVRRITP